jgi:hypothetical protein
MSRIDLNGQPSTPPAICTLTTKLYYAGPNKLEDEAYETIQAEIDSISGDHNLLFWTLVGLEAMTQIMTKLGDKTGAEKLWAFIRTQPPRYPAFESELSSNAQDRSEALKSSAPGLTGATQEKVAPVFGKAAPKGTTRLSDLIPQNQLRPPIPRKK